MPRLLVPLVLLALAGGCKDGPGKDGEGEDVAAGNLEFWPPEAGRGTSVEGRLTAGSSVFDFESTEVDLGDGVRVDAVTVLDGWTALVDFTVQPDAVLGARDVTISTGGSGDLRIREGLEIVDDSFTISPDRALIGETIEVEFLGQNTEWEPGTTWAFFGDGIQVNDVQVLSETYALASVSVESDAVPGLRDVSMQVGPELTTLYNGFQVDRVSLTAHFDPTQVEQGETVDFTIEGRGTHFSEDTELSFWRGGEEKVDAVVDWITAVDAEHLYGQMTVSNAAELGWRDVMVSTDEEGAFIEDAFEVVAGPVDLSDVAISLAFYVVRGIDNATGALYESVVGQAIFYIPLDPACPPNPENSYPGGCTDGEDNDEDNYTDCYDSDCEMDLACSLGGPQPYDANGVWSTRETGGSADCPTPTTLGAGDHVWFESPCNVVQLDKYIDAASGLIYYTADLTMDDYCPGQFYDLHTQGEEGAIGEYVLEGVQPTVPADWYLLTPELWGNYTHDRTEDFHYTWTPAQTYPDAIFVTSISGTLVSTGEGGYAGSVPWDDGDHTYTPAELLELEPGNVTFTAYSYIEGPYFGFPFSTIQSNQSNSYIYLQASMVLE